MSHFVVVVSSGKRNKKECFNSVGVEILICVGLCFIVIVHFFCIVPNYYSYFLTKQCDTI